MAYTPQAKRRFLTALVGLAVVAMVALYLANLLYIQFLIVIWSVVITLALVVYDRDAHRSAPRGEGATKKSQLTEALSNLDTRISKADREDVKRVLRRQRDQLEHDIRRLDWSMREQELANFQLPPAGQGLTPLPRGPGWGQRRAESRRESAHLRLCLEAADEVLTREDGEAAREGLRSVANDLRAHYDLVRGSRPESRSLDDYRMGWGVLTAICGGTEPEFDFGRYATRGSRSRLEGIVKLARAKGLMTTGRGSTE